MIQRAILSYIDHLEDRAYLTATLASAPIEQTQAAIVDLLHSPDPEIIGYTTLFIRDSLLYLPETPFHEEFPQTAMFRRWKNSFLPKTGSLVATPSTHLAR